MASTQSTNGLMQPQKNKLAKMLSAGVNSIPVEIDPDLMSPDSYKGHLRFTVTGLEDLVTISTSLNVRNGPFSGHWLQLLLVFSWSHGARYGAAHCSKTDKVAAALV